MRANMEMILTFEELHELAGLPPSVSIIWAVNDNADNRSGILRLMIIDETMTDLPPGTIPLAQTMDKIIGGDTQ